MHQLHLFYYNYRLSGTLITILFYSYYHLPVKAGNFTIPKCYFMNISSMYITTLRQDSIDECVIILIAGLFV